MRKLFAILSVACMVGFTATIATAGEQEEPVCTEIVHHDAVPAVTHEEVTPAVWANFSPNDTQATFVGPAIWPLDARGTWHIHSQGIPGGHVGPDGVYSKGNPAKGGNWFYRQAEVTVVVVDEPEIPAYDEEVEVPCPPTGPTGPTGPTETPDPPTGPTGPTGPTPSDEWSPSWTPSWTPPGKLQTGEAPKNTAHTGADVTGALAAAEMLGAIGFGSLAAGYKRKK